VEGLVGAGLDRLTLPARLRGAACDTGAVAPGRVGSVNVGSPRAVGAKSGLTGIDKRPVAGPIRVDTPPAGCSALEGDSICDPASHGGPAQAVYAFAREDLDWWQERLGRRLSNGTFGENLTTMGLDVSGARLGERWRIGEDLTVAVTGPRIPCATFAVWMDTRGWLKTFTDRARPGAYLRVVCPGQVCKGDEIEVVSRPDHDVDVGLSFRALTTSRELLPRLLEAGEHLEPELRDLALAGRGFDVDDDPLGGGG
jgi:MOSC domain-containing protein YiiM